MTELDPHDVEVVRSGEDSQSALEFARREIVESVARRVPSADANLVLPPLVSAARSAAGFFWPDPVRPLVVAATDALFQDAAVIAATRQEDAKQRKDDTESGTAHGGRVSASCLSNGIAWASVRE